MTSKKLSFSLVIYTSHAGKKKLEAFVSQNATEMSFCVESVPPLLPAIGSLQKFKQELAQLYKKDPKVAKQEQVKLIKQHKVTFPPPDPHWYG
jgi:hypothetical protein